MCDLGWHTNCHTVNTSVHTYNSIYTFWFSIKTMIFSTEFISSISCILLHHTRHICCREEDGCLLGNHGDGYHDHHYHLVLTIKTYKTSQQSQQSHPFQGYRVHSCKHDEEHCCSDKNLHCSHSLTAVLATLQF